MNNLYIVHINEEFYEDLRHQHVVILSDSEKHAIEFMKEKYPIFMSVYLSDYKKYLHEH